MARPRRIELAGAVYHLTSRGNARQSIYRTGNSEDRRHNGNSPPAGTRRQRSIVPGGQYGGAGGAEEVYFPDGS